MESQNIGIQRYASFLSDPDSLALDRYKNKQPYQDDWGL